MKKKPKKILFDRLRPVNDTPANKVALLYMTVNCKQLSDDRFLEVINTYTQFDKFIVLVTDPEEYKQKFSFLPHLEFPDMPVDNLFEKFTTYIYTRTKAFYDKDCGCFDCSPRFISECKFYGKDILYHRINDAYLSVDTGLKYRKYDIENNFDSIHLRDNDPIIDILNEKIEA